MKIAGLLIFFGLIFVGIAIHRISAVNQKPFMPLSIKTEKPKIKPGLIIKCDPFWEAQNQALEKAKKTTFIDVEAVFYLKSIAYGKVYKNCLLRGEK